MIYGKEMTYVDASAGDRHEVGDKMLSGMKAFLLVHEIKR